MAGTGVDRLILMLKKLQDDGAKVGQALRRGTDAPGPSAAKKKRKNMQISRGGHSNRIAKGKVSC